MVFNLETAGHVVRIESLYEKIYLDCDGFVTEKPPETVIRICQDDIANERLKNQDDGIVWSDEYLETLAVLRKLSDYYAGNGILLFHASAVAVDGTAYLFTAPSGTGKSTHTRLWRELFGDRAVMINDDKPFVDVKNGFVTYGSPWNGKHRLGNPVSAGINGICWLNRGAENTIEQIDADVAFSELVKRVYMPSDPVLLKNVIEMVMKVCKSIPVYKLLCNMEPEAAKVSYEMMSRK